MRKKWSGDELAVGLVAAWPEATSGPGLVWCQKVVATAARLEDINLARCNRPTSQAEEDAADKAEARITDLVKERGPGWGVAFQRDPRGCAVRILRPDDRKGEEHDDGVRVDVSARPIRSLHLLNRSAVRAAALELAAKEIGRGKVKSVSEGVFRDCEHAVRQAIARVIAQHRRGSSTLKGAVVLVPRRPR